MLGILLVSPLNIKQKGVLHFEKHLCSSDITVEPRGLWNHLELGVSATCLAMVAMASGLTGG